MTVTESFDGQPSKGPSKRPLAPGRRLARALGGLLGAAVILSGGLTVHNLVAPVTTTSEQIRLPIEQTRLSMDVTSGDVVLRRGSGTEVVIDRTMRYSTTEPRVLERSDADGVRIDADCSGLVDWNCDVSYDIAVPDGFDLDVGAGAGSLTVRDLTVATLQLQISSGDVELIGVAGRVDVRVSSGSVAAQRLTSDDVNVEVSSGDLALDFAAPPRTVVATVSSGRIEIGLPTGTYNVDAETASGDERVDLPVDNTSDRLIHARTSRGDIEVVGNAR